MKKINVITLFLSVFIFSCSKKDSSCNYDACAFKAPASEISSLKDYLDANSILATEHCSGVFYIIENPGTGKAPTPCSNISVKYKGSLINGTVFDQQTSAVSFNLGMLVTSWRNVIPLLKAGGRMVMYVPPSLGYGNQANGPIPANSVLVFEVDLVDVQ